VGESVTRYKCELVDFSGHAAAAKAGTGCSLLQDHIIAHREQPLPTAFQRKLLWHGDLSHLK